LVLEQFSSSGTVFGFDKLLAQELDVVVAAVDDRVEGVGVETVV
jgi:hypothetical protein